MPVLHKYKDREGHYILTAINGKIITFQLSSNGLQKLITAGIAPGEKFGRALLLELYSTGEAFTGGTGLGTIAPPVDRGQIDLPFDDPRDPDSEKIFPKCFSCASINDLHLVEIKDNDHYASILCDKCRPAKSAVINSSLPLPLVTRALLIGLLEIKNIARIDDSAADYIKLLDTQFAAKWEVLAKNRPAIQGTLFNKDEKQGHLL